MGTSTSASVLARKLNTFATELPKVASLSALKAAEAVRVAVSVASGPYASSPHARTRATLLPNQTVLVRMTSRKAHLLDHDTKAGAPILPGAVTGRRGKKMALTTPDGRRASATKGATKGKFMFELGVEAARPKVGAIVSESVSAAMLKVFG